MEFRGNGKLLISGEYAVLDGALSFAIPTIYGQRLRIHPFQKKEIYWVAHLENMDVWEDVTFDLASLNIIRSSNAGFANQLQQLLKAAQTISPTFLGGSEGYTVETFLEFPKDWGLGSSSTLVHCIAQWAKVNPYVLLQKTFGGSGYDLACANSRHPLLYRKATQPIVKKIHPIASFWKDMLFVYLNKKQNSRDGIQMYRQKKTSKEWIERISKISENLSKTKDLEQCKTLLEEHEKLLSANLGLKMVKEEHFPDYTGIVKSLGAWGGDFIMATRTNGDADYFRERGFHVQFRGSDLLLID